MEFVEFIVEKGLVLVPTLWIVGAFLKRTPKVPDWVIPWVLVAGGVLGCLGVLGASPDAVVQGVLVAGAAVLGHQLVVQTATR